MADTGLLISQFDEAVIKALISGDLGYFKGALYENIIAQILHSKRKKLNYYEPYAITGNRFYHYYQGK